MGTSADQFSLNRDLHSAVFELPLGRRTHTQVDSRQTDQVGGELDFPFAISIVHMTVLVEPTVRLRFEVDVAGSIVFPDVGVHTLR